VSVTCVCEKGLSTHLYEADMARRWWSLPLEVRLPLSDGNACQLLYAGRTGGPMGPDVRDAVLGFTSHDFPAAYKGAGSSQQVKNVVGDVEFHIRASDWFAHQHHTDVRYNNVILHVVLICDEMRPTVCQGGRIIPTCSLYDLPYTTHQAAIWPCHHVMLRMNVEERTRLLKLAGMLRFAQKARAFCELLRDAQARGPFSAYDSCLIPALAEGLGYGRDRAFFRAAGLRLSGFPGEVPEPLGRAPEPSPLDAGRLRILHDLVEQWRASGAWATMRPMLLPTPCVGAGEGTLGSPQVGGDHPLSEHEPGTRATQASPPHSTQPPPLQRRLSLLRGIFTGLSKARTDILICNVVLPFASAVAQRENDKILAEQARDLYDSYPSLSSNQVTRAMCKQLLLQSEPKGACQQQGLHFIYAQTCRDKRCEQCIIGKQDL
jgi:hypothetical protein